MKVITLINFLIGIVFFVCYFYQFVYLVIPFLKKDKRHEPATLRRYGILIAARNEEAVIGQLIESIHNQSYPREWLEIFVVADNCTDHTAEAARMAGAHVYERFNRLQVGKGYALEYLLNAIEDEWGWDSFDGYFVFDADNLLDEHYIAEMHREICDGYQAVTSYRNSKNYGDNWISAGYSLWFLRESEALNHARKLLGTNCFISGTGFYISSELIRRYGGWKWFLLTEDTELTTQLILDGIRVGYCSAAVFYDEQPVRFSESWHQRLRWAKGFLQVYGRYGGQLTAGIIKKRNFACFDMTMATMPAIALSMCGLVMNVAGAFAGGLTGADIGALLWSAAQTLGNTYLLMLFVGTVSLVSQWKRIHCETGKKIGYLFTFPVFMMTYIPVAAAALVSRKVEWKPVKHTQVKSLSQVKSGFRSIN